MFYSNNSNCRLLDGYIHYLKNHNMSKLQCYNPFNTPPITGEVIDEPSMAVPDQSLTVQEILKRYAKGLPLGGQRVPMYEDDEIDDLPDMAHMDLADKQEYFESVRSEITNIQNQFNANKKIAAQKKLEASRAVHASDHDDDGSQSFRSPNKGSARAAATGGAKSEGRAEP